MKFLIVSAFPPSLIAFRGALIRDLVASGCEVHVAMPAQDASAQLQGEIRGLGVAIHDVPIWRTGLNPFKDSATLWRLFRLMRRIRPDCIFAYTAKPVIYGLLAGRASGVPRLYALVTGLGYAFTGERTGLASHVVKFLYRVSLQSSSKVFFQNRDDQALFRSSNLMPCSTPSVVVAGSGVDVTFYQQTPLPSVVSFLMVARLLGDKGCREYISAARRVSAVRPGVSFHLVGWIDENPDAIAESELRQWLDEGVVQYWGRLDDVRPAISAAAVYVLPSYREGTPRTVLEAMAMGRPVITTDAPGCRETVVDSDNGYLVPVKSVDALVRAMLRFVDDPDLVPRMGQRSRQIAEEKYDVRKVNAVMLREMGGA